MTKNIFVTFINKNRKIYHIWQTRQVNKHDVNVTIDNAFSKAKTALSGKGSAQSVASTSFYRILPNTRKEDWSEYCRKEVEFETLAELQQSRDDLQEELEELGFYSVSRRNRALIYSGKYSGSEWKVRKLSNMTLVQVKTHVQKMMEDCFVSDETIMAQSAKIAMRVLYKEPDIDNISQLWQNVYQNYGGIK
jgi:hypothetical protein